MDILTHTLSGVAFATVIASFSGKGFKEKAGFLALGGLGGAMPDADAISLWSGFDASFGKLFALNHSGGQIYFGKFWYSHHGFAHSIACSLLFALLIGAFIYLVGARFKKVTIRELLYSYGKNKFYLLSFIAGFIIHLLEDMPTPACVWSGVNFFWPSAKYTGGTGDIWWWNNYDIFLVVVGIIIINSLILIVGKVMKLKVWKAAVIVFITGVALSLVQIKTRNFDFNYTGQTSRYQYFEKKSREIQKRILGDRLYQWMIRFDNKLPVNF